MNREATLESVRRRDRPWDLIVIGGGATGVGCALDAAGRGFDVLLLERSDFGKGTSSRSTKLVHGGVRYLAQGDLALVREALKERGRLLENAPHLVEKLPFIVPCYSLWQKFYYGVGLKVYNLLSGRYSFGRSRILSGKETIEKLPNVKRERLRGGVLYFDGQFDDARLLIDLVRTAAEKGAALLNYARVFELLKNGNGRISGVKFTDAETGEIFEAEARAVINATGAFSDAVRRLSNENSSDLIKPSQGVHLVFDRSFLPGDCALMIPKTSDGRVLFAIPFGGKTLVGTTDTPIERPEAEPVAFEKEIEFILETARDHLARPPKRKDILSVFAGIRPLVRSSADAGNTAALSRDHTIEIDESGLLTITGGKWTTYRRMAEDAVNQALTLAGLPEKPCPTRELRIKSDKDLSEIIKEDPSLKEKLHPDFPYQRADVVFAVRKESARTLEDILARRTRLLFLDARAAIQTAPSSAEIMAAELNQDREWIEMQISEFEELAEKYLVKG
ncbi:MAG: glycerol-3-phosphate dehydrogenase/oxidase [Pyrinomonadaceae bacterium]